MNVEGYNMPEDLYYNKGFMWARVKENNIIVAGLIDYAQKLAGDISFVDLPFAGDEVAFNAEVGSVETGKWVGKLFAPVAGKIKAVNEKLNDDPTAINKDPYSEGWIFELEMADPADLDKLMKIDAAAAWLKEEAKKH